VGQQKLVKAIAWPFKHLLISLSMSHDHDSCMRGLYIISFGAQRNIDASDSLLRSANFIPSAHKVVPPPPRVELKNAGAVFCLSAEN